MGTRVQVLNDSVRWSPSSRSSASPPPSQAYADENTAPNHSVDMDHAPAPPPHSAGFCSTISPPLSTRQGEDSPTKSCSSPGCSSEHVDPLIVFDWDDTMLASSWIQLRALLQTDCNEDLPAEARRDLAILEQSAIKCLTNARGLGTVIIITNAESGWVQLSAGKFFVDLLPLLDGIPIVSARSLFEGQFPGSPLCWKSAAFAYMMHDHFLDRSRWAQKTVVSIGDSNEEKMAMRIASGQHCAMAAKSVKFIAGPDPEALACQLDFVSQHLASIVSTDSDVEIILEPSMIRNACSFYPLHPCELYEEQQRPCADAPTDLSPIRPPVDDPSEGSTVATASRPLGTSYLKRSAAGKNYPPRPRPQQEQPQPHARTSSRVPLKAPFSRPGTPSTADAGAASKPIPIPGGGRGGTEAGGECVQPLSATQAGVGGASCCRCPVALGSASGFRGAAMEVAVTKLEECVSGESGDGSGGARSDGGGVCGAPCDSEGGCGGPTCMVDGDKSLICPNDAKLAVMTVSRGAAPIIPREAISEPDSFEMNGSGIRGAELNAVAEGVGSEGEEGVFEFDDDDIMARAAPMA